MGFVNITWAWGTWWLRVRVIGDLKLTAGVFRDEDHAGFPGQVNLGMITSRTIQQGYCS